MGPNARQLLERAAPFDRWDDESFPFGTSRDVQIGTAMLRAQRVTYVGELGWELYVPAEMSRSVYRALHEVSADGGEDLGLRNGGYYAVEGLRVEKAYRAWGHELSPDYTSLEAGLGFCVDLDDGDATFMGKDALLRQRDVEGGVAGLKRRLVCLQADISANGDDAMGHPEIVPWGDEAILFDGQHIGSASSSAYGHTLDKGVFMGYLNHEEVGVGRCVDGARSGLQ